MLAPKRTKFRKQHRGRRKGKATAANKLDFGEYGLQALEPCWLTAQQIESARMTIAKYLKRAGKMWIRVFPDKPVSKKPAETRMGKGKGEPAFWVAVVKPGRILFELEGIPEEEVISAFRLASDKLPCKTRIVKREEIGYETI